MNRSYKPRPSLGTLLRSAPILIAACAPWAAQAQTTATSTATAPASAQDDTIMMSVFEVSSSDEKGYTASSALTGTRTNEKLENLPNSISVFTSSLMSDLAIVDFFGAVDNGIGVENVFNDTGVVGAPVGASASNQVSFRGINSLRQLRDGFVWFVPQDNFNVERIEFVRGPNGTSYGDVDPVGTLNMATKRPSFRRSASTSARVDNFGTQRYTVDINQPLMKRLTMRVNGVYSDMEQSRERADRLTRAVAGAVRWLPFGNRRTQIDFNIEKGSTRNNLSALHLNDGISAYVRGTGTNALDANPNVAGTQTNGIGMRQIASGNTHVYLDMDGKLYDMRSTSTTIFRNSCILTGSSNASGSDPQNPNRIPLLTVPFDIYPYGQDWSGPSNYTYSKYHAFNVELTHTLTDNLRFLVAMNGQANDSNTLTMHSGSSALGMNTRAVFIDVNRVLPDPNNANATIPNPHFEDYFVCYVPVKSSNGAKATGWRASLVHDLKLPFGQSSLRTVGGATYRHERNYNNSFRYALTTQEMARRGITGKAATFGYNAVNPIHYLVDGNSYDALVFREQPSDVAAFYRQGTGNTRYDQTLGSASITSLGSFFRERIHTNVGVSRYYFRQNRSETVVNDAINEAHFVDRAGNYIDNPGNYGDVPLYAFKRGYTTNQSYGGVVRVLPWMSLSTGFFQSSLFTESTTTDLRGNPALPLNGEGWEYSVRFNLMNDRVFIAVTNFDTSAQNKTLSLSSNAVTELNELLPADKQLTGTGDYRDQVSKGWEVEVQMNMTRNWTFRASYSTSKTNYTRFYPFVREYLALARAEAVNRGLDPDNETQLTSQMIADTEGSVSKVRRETANLVTRYSFERGILKGVNIGTSMRYVLGKPLAALSSCGVVAVPAGKTDTDVITSPFVSYSRKVFGYRTTFQLNVNNVFNDRSHQGNNYTWIRYNEPRQFISTVTVNF